MAKKKKKKSKIRKILGALGKAALIGGGLYGASKVFGGRKGAVSTVGQPVGVSRTAYKPSHLGETFHPTKWENMARNYKDPIMTGGAGVKHSRRPIWTGNQTMGGGDMFYKKGGKVTGIAKRGFGRALMKGKK